MNPIPLLLVALCLARCATFAQQSAAHWEAHVLKADSLFRTTPADTAAILSSLLDSEILWYTVETDTGTARVFNPVGEPLWIEEPSITINEQLLFRTHEIRLALLGKHHPHVARSLERIGMVHVRHFRIPEAIATFEQALEIHEAVYGSEHSELGRTLHCLGFLHRYQYRFDKAEEYLTRSLRNREMGLPPDDPNISYSLNGLAHLYFNLGRYKDAEKHYRRALVQREKAYGPLDPAALVTRSNLIRLYITQGRFDEAERMLTGNLEAESRVNTMSAQLLQLYVRSGKYDAAIEYAKDRIGRLLKQLGNETPFIGNMLAFLGETYERKRQFDTAEMYFLQAIDNLEKTPTIGAGRDPEGVRQLLAGLYLKMKRIEDATTLIENVVRSREEAFGSSHLALADALEVRSRCHLLAGRMEKSLHDASSAFRIRQRHFEQSFPVMAEYEALSTFRALRESASNYLTCFFSLPDPSQSQRDEAFEIIASVKGRVSDGMMERNRNSTVAGPHRELMDEYATAKGRLSNLYLQGPNKHMNYRKIIDSLQYRVRDIESELAERSAEFNSSLVNRYLSASTILPRIPESSVLIEFLRYTRLDPESMFSSEHYLAVVLDKSGVSYVADLGQASRIDSLVGSLRDQLKAPANPGEVTTKQQRRYAVKARELYSAILAPVISRVPKRAQILIAPDGGINLVSFAGLVTPSGKYLIEEHPVHYVTSSRDLLRIGGEQESGAGLLLFGDPDYYVSGIAETKASNVKPQGGAGSGNSYATRNLRTDCSALQEMILTALPSSQQEVRAIASFWSGQKSREEVTSFVGRSASEENLKRHAAGKRVIHLATHGYFLGSECRQSVPEGGAGFENPLLHSGVFLAGANLRGAWADTADADDGIVTALEVSSMNLRGTDLVVLSACETGLGKVEQGEGVYGLRRAFQMAGAKTVVSALWQIPDVETTRFMKTLYSAAATSYPALLQQAALKHITEARRRGRSTHPFTWGAFVATGDWRIK